MNKGNGIKQIVSRNFHKTIVGIVVWLLGFGLAMALFPIRPFWNDEWRLIYNIKFKTYTQLWGKLDLLQECPRVYLCFLKLVSSVFDYSYSSLRFPPLIIGFLSVVLLFHLKKNLIEKQSKTTYLFILILVSSQTFTDYLTQVKQYEIDILLSLVTLWQLHKLYALSEGEKISRTVYFVLCLSLLLVPFLSYVYPITVAPLFPLFGWICFSKIRKEATLKWQSTMLKLILPLIIVAISISVFYRLDVKQVMHNNNMYHSYMKSYYHSNKETFLGDVWNLFALVGSGFLFELVFGVLGLVSFVYRIVSVLRRKQRMYTFHYYLQLYALMLLVFVLLLLYTGKIIGGVARLTAFAVPSISLLLVSFLQEMKTRFHYKRTADVIVSILFVGLFGNLVSTCINSFTYDDYANRMNTYWNTSKALKEARKQKIPILITDGVCGDLYIVAAQKPGKLLNNTIDKKQIDGADTLCAEAIVKVNPEYKMNAPVPIYYMPDSKWMSVYFSQLPKEYSFAIVGDGLHYSLMKR
jgi:hypothetical protein